MSMDKKMKAVYEKALAEHFRAELVEEAKAQARKMMRELRRNPEFVALTKDLLTKAYKAALPKLVDDAVKSVLDGYW